jgi:hypothetical protein
VAMTRITFVVLTIIIAATLMEAFSALVLFRYFLAINYFFYPSGLATTFLIKKNSGRFHPIFSTTPSPLFIPDKELGFTTTAYVSRLFEDNGFRLVDSFLSPFGVKADCPEHLICQKLET